MEKNKLMISCYNKNGIGDTLLIMTENSNFSEQGFEENGDVVRIFKSETNETVGFNFFHISNHLTVSGNGQIYLTEDQVAVLNELIQKAGFDYILEVDNEPKFVVGFVKECVPHPDSDHLSITQVEVGNDETVQIVCGAPNIAVDQKVVVAKVGAMMPNGLIIWDGELRGEASHGMICSAKELNLADAPAQKGILVLPADSTVGEAFEIGE